MGVTPSALPTAFSPVAGMGGGLLGLSWAPYLVCFLLWWKSGDVALLTQGTQLQNGQEHLELCIDLGESSR